MKKVMKAALCGCFLSLAHAAPHIECVTQYNQGSEETLTANLDGNGDAMINQAGLSSGQSLFAEVKDSKIEFVKVAHPNSAFTAKGEGLGVRKRTAKASLAFFDGVQGDALAEVKASCRLKEVGGGRGGRNR